MLKMMIKHSSLMLGLDMISKLLRLITVLIGVVFVQTPLSADISSSVLKKSEAIIEKQWPQASIVAKKLTDYPQNRLSSDLFYTISVNNEAVAYAILGQAESKSQPVYFLVILDTSLTIQGIELPGLRGSKNAPLKSRFWRKQFIGANQKNRKIKEIDAITGATISSDAIKAKVERLLTLISLTKE